MRSASITVLTTTLVAAIAAAQPPAPASTGPAGQPATPPAAPPAAAAPAEPAAPRDLSDLLRPIVERTGAPGLVAAAVVDGRVVALGAAGVRAKGEAAAVTPADKFHIGSCTKAITATLCAVLVQDGTLRWDLTLADAFPELGEQLHSNYRSVTLLDLLHHRAGLPTDLNASGIWGRMWQHEGPPDKTRADLLPEILKLPPAVSRGTFQYANAGYALAGHICERVAQKPYETLVRERVLAPLGITSAGFGAPGSADTLDQPRGHRAGEPVAPGKAADNPPAIAPAGTMHMTITDWARFAAAHVAGHRGEPTPILKPDAFAVLHAAAPRSPDDRAGTPDYAAGWNAVDRAWAGGPAFTHSGSNTMWFATVWLAPGRNLAVLAAANAADPETQKAVDQACAAMINVVTAPPPPPTPVDR